MITAKLEYDEFVRRARRLGTVEAQARLAASRDGTHAAMRHIFYRARRDTRRFVRAWAIANNMAGLPALPVESVKASNYADKYLEILGDQVDTFSAKAARLDALIEARFRRTGRAMRGRYYNELSGGLTRALVRLEKAREELKQAARRHEPNIPDYLFMGVLTRDGQYRPLVSQRNRPQKDGAFKKPIRYKARQLASVRVKVYGGFGRMYHNTEGTYFVLQSLEPHTTLVERRFHVIRGALEVARSRGVQRITGEYKRGIKAVFG